MRVKLNRIRIFFIFFSICFFATAILLGVEYHNKLSFIKKFSSIYLESSIYSYRSEDLNKGYSFYRSRPRKDIYKERLSNYDVINHQYDRYQDSILYFTENEEWEYRTLFIHDTVYNRKVIKKPNIHLEQIFMQSSWMLKGELEIDSVLKIYRQTLEENRIFLEDQVHLSVKRELHDSVEYKTFESYEELVYNYATPIHCTGYMDEIMYQVFLNITFKAVYRLMHKPYYYGLYGIVLILLVLFLWTYLTDFFRKRSTVIRDLGGNRFRVGHLIFDHGGQKLYYDETFPMSTKTADLLLLFLRSKDLSVSKKFLLYECVHLDNLTSAVHRVRKVLQDSGCNYELRNMVRERCYRLVPLTGRKRAKKTPPPKKKESPKK